LVGFGQSAKLELREAKIMTSMNVSLPDDMTAFIEEQVAREGFASASEYFSKLVREAQRRKAKQNLEAKLAEGLLGPIQQMLSKDWQALEQEALEGLAGERIGE
jgi:antitoxin ParD1/3/4